MNLIGVTSEFGTNEKSLAYLEALRWPDGVTCTECGGDRISKITRHTAGKNRQGIVYQCLNPKCKAQLSAASGTLFNDSHLALTKWFLAVAPMCNAKKGISAKQMQRDLHVSYKTAWYLCHRIRKAMEEGELPKFTGTVEADETYIGGRYDRRRKQQPWEKQGVMGFVERGGRVEAYPIPTPSTTVLVGKIKDRVSTDAELVVTDQYIGRKAVDKTHPHAVINHIRQWVRGNIHTNTIENFWSLFKRGVIGSFHKVSAKHLPRYPAEFSCRFIRRAEENIFMMTLARLLGTIALPYERLIAEP
jgi:hypothetical protein